jgi:hypothetical protein
MSDFEMGNLTREIIRRIKGDGTPGVELGGAAHRYWESASARLRNGLARARAVLRVYMIESGKPVTGGGVSCRKKYRARDLEPKRSWRRKLFKN